MSRPQLVIFDCDGVLVDSERIAIRVDAVVLARIGWPLTEAEIIARFVGRSDVDICRDMSEHLGRPIAPGWDAEYTHLYREAFEAELEPVDGIVEALDRIRIATCVASSGTHERIRFTLGKTGLYERFAGRIFSASEVTRGKPAPDLFRHAAEKMGVVPEQCAVVEDSRFGVEAARAAGMRVFGYAGGVTPAARLEGPGTIIFHDMHDLPRLLGEA